MDPHMTRPVFDPEKKRGSLQRRSGLTYGEITALMVRMRDMEGMSLKAIARQLGCAHTTVRYHLIRPASTDEGLRNRMRTECGDSVSKGEQ